LSPNQCIYCAVKIRSLERELEETKKQLQEALGSDPLTGLVSKKRAYEELEHHFARIHRDKKNGHSKHARIEPLSIIFIDLDGFKAVNDGNHLRGDRLLIEFGDYLRAITREVDMVARFGGDEFFIIAPNTSREQAEILCNKIKTGLELYDFDSKYEALKLRASVASASTSEGYGEYMEMIKEADERMQIQKNHSKTS